MNMNINMNMNMKKKDTYNKPPAYSNKIQVQ